MIEAKELRKNNLVHKERYEREGYDVVKVLGYTETDVIFQLNAKAYEFEYDEFEYIPLTEEWLMRFGFEYFKDNDSFQYDNELGFTIWGRLSEGFYLHVQDVDCGQSIHFVHQLQNLYFALTGEELQLKEA